MSEALTKEARYQAIAFAVANRIRNKELLPGDKLRGRSVLAAEYQVSSETVRKALNLLAKVGVVTMIERSGAYVASVEAADQYIKHYSAQYSEQAVVSKLEHRLKEHKKYLKLLEKDIQHVLQSRKRDVFPFQFFALTLTKESPWNEKPIASAKIYDAVGGTLLAVDSVDGFIQNPPQEMLLRAGMVLYILGDDTVQARSKPFE